LTIVKFIENWKSEIENCFSSSWLPFGYKMVGKEKLRYTNKTDTKRKKKKPS